jgi:hypothetical protein
MLVYLSIVIPVAPTWRVGIATGYGLDDWEVGVRVLEG